MPSVKSSLSFWLLGLVLSGHFAPSPRTAQVCYFRGRVFLLMAKSGLLCFAPTYTTPASPSLK